jgi:hypothetical protein
VIVRADFALADGEYPSDDQWAGGCTPAIADW